MLAQIESRIARLESASAVERLQRALGYYLDQALWDEAADLFTNDASLEIALDGVYHGRERIRRYLQTLGGGRRGLEHGRLHEFLQLQPIIHVAADAESAKARWRTLILSGRHGKHAAWAEGPYENEYRREDGVWKISKLHWYQTFEVPYQGGWARHPDLTRGKHISTLLAPDAAPTVQYEVWPGVHTPPFHFETVGAGSGPERTPANDGKLAVLERRIGTLEDTAAIENVIGAYGYFLDKQLWDRVAELFAEDGTMEISLRGIYAGRESIRRALELFGPSGIQPGSLHNHLQLQPVIHVAADGRRAWTRSRAFSQLGSYQGASLWHGGVYESELVKVAGIWKFRRDHVYTTYFADYERGFAFGARTAPEPSAAIPPDLPPSERYAAFPGTYIPPFHYYHPVTGAEIPRVSHGTRAPVQAAALAALSPTSSGAFETLSMPGTSTPGIARAACLLQRLEDEHAIEILQRTYGYFIDKALWQDAADLFCDGGTLEIGGHGTFVGKRRILELLTGLGPQGLTAGRLFDHLQLQPVITVAEDGMAAQGRWRLFAQVAEHEKSATWILGTCENEYVKEGGIWKIRTLEAHLRLCAPYAEGWGAAALGLPDRLKAMLPDLPPRAAADPYPGTFIPSCHFAHPVTGRASDGSVRLDSPATEPPPRHTAPE